MKFLKRLFKFMFCPLKYNLGTSSTPRPFPTKPVKPMTVEETKAWISKMRGGE